MNRIKAFWKDETGLELSEYAVGAGLITIALVAAWQHLGSRITAQISGVTARIPGE